MKRTTGIAILLAALGGCSSLQQGSDSGFRGCCDGHIQPVPNPSPTSWTENDRLPRADQYHYAGGSAGSAVGPVGARTGSAAPTMMAMNTPAPSSMPPSLGGTSPAALASDPMPLPLPDQTGSRSPSVPEPFPAAPPDPLLTPAARSEPTVPVPGKTMKSAPDGGIVMLDHQPNHPAGPAVRMINSKRITINYELKDVGPSGVSGVELWYTQDGSKSWKKREVPPQSQPPYIIEVNDEGLYGFTLLARNGVGLSKDPPQPGDLPQVWVEVDLTSPVVHLTGVNAKCTSKSQNVVIRWTATDKNLAPKPITLSYAQKAEGPWKPIATHLENTGRFEWPLPTEVPSRFLIRVEATDAVGNLGMDQTPKPVLMDRAQPTVSIITIEAGK
jgi:hypothetical protein